MTMCVAKGAGGLLPTVHVPDVAAAAAAAAAHMLGAGRAASRALSGTDPAQVFLLSSYFLCVSMPVCAHAL